MNPSDSIVVTGGSGLLGSALKNVLKAQGYTNVHAPTSGELDLLDLKATQGYFEARKPTYVFHLAGQVYGLMGNLRNKGLSFFRNTMINTHVVESSRSSGVRKVVGMGSICVYPYPAPRPGPLTEDIIWQGPPHPGEEFYGHAKRAMYAQLKAYKESYGLDYAFVMSTNLYGPNDKFDIENGHVVPSLVAKFNEASRKGSQVTVWGDGRAERDFLYIEDAANGLVEIMKHGSGPMNLATGQMRKIRDVVEILRELSGIGDNVEWDKTKPNGHDFVGFNVDRIREIGFVPKHSLEEGLTKTYRWYAENYSSARH